MDFDAGHYRKAVAEGKPAQRPLFSRFTEKGVLWLDGSDEAVDAVIFGTGYRPGFPYLAGLGAVDDTGQASEAPPLRESTTAARYGRGSATVIQMDRQR